MDLGRRRVALALLAAIATTSAAAKGPPAAADGAPPDTADTTRRAGAETGTPATPLASAATDRSSSSARADAPADLVPEPSGYRTDAYRAPVPATLAGAVVVDTPAARTLWEAKAAFVDVLPRPPRPKLPPGTLWRPPVREHIPGSAWLVNTGFGALSPAAEAYFFAGLDRVTGGDKAAPVVFYCMSDCWMSWNAARRAVAAGYTGVRWYPAGTDGWAAASLPLVRAEPDPGEPLRPDE